MLCLVLEELFDIYYIEDRVTGAEGVSIDSYLVTGKTVAIDGEMFENGFKDTY